MGCGQTPGLLVIVASFYAPREEKWGADYIGLLRLLDASCVRLGIDHMCISDRELPGVSTLVCDLPDNLMQALLDGQRQCLEWTTEPVLFVGADCLLVHDPRVVMGGDMAITVGPFADCEMNTGAIWCHNPQACVAVWQAALDIGPTEWGEDQVALYEAVKASGLDVRRLACEQYNWAPDSARDDAGMPMVAHFRGNRKRFMAAWAAQHLGIA